MRDLANGAAGLLDSLEDNGDAILITRRGRPVAVLSAIDKRALDEFLRDQTPSYAVHRSTT